MCSFHAQPILTARLRSASRCRANYRKGGLSSQRLSSHLPRRRDDDPSPSAAKREETPRPVSRQGITCATGHGNSVVSLTGVGVMHGGGRRCAGGLMLRRLRRYPEGSEERSWHRARGGARRRRALLAYEQARGREPEELGSLEPRPIVTRQVRGLRGNLHRHRDAG